MCPKANGAFTRNQFIKMIRLHFWPKNPFVQQNKKKREIAVWQSIKYIFKNAQKSKPK